ncbi:conserved Plasmodium protein, unknown function [Plasmodium vinckei vinckei]|uniref:Uncharacterized protein n=1 Tax=Plasmodium vinckei vinckei TaxID=54757 RepID=A0A449BSD4_PLAVN|nr:conserved Plasmodium protein, unknown function [Plasmodium vinckei vinckei]VEV56249.1 conserved Plasmodium protein, unknown function [Plasmodium vinckei vinckei]
MIILQFFFILFLFVLSNIKCICSLKFDKFKNKLYLQGNKNGSNQNYHKRKISPLFINSNYKDNVNFRNSYILDKLKNNYTHFMTYNRHKNKKSIHNGILTFSIPNKSEAKEMTSIEDAEKESSQKKNVENVNDDQNGKNVFSEKEYINLNKRNKIYKLNGTKYNKGKTDNLNIVDIQNINVKDFLVNKDENRSLALQDYIYKSWKEKNFSNFFNAINNSAFNYMCIEQWLHKLSISLNKNHLKIKLIDDNILIRSNQFSNKSETAKEMKIGHDVINNHLKMLIDNIDKFCSYEITSILWAITIILLKVIKTSNNLENGIYNVKHTDLVISILNNFKLFFSKIIKNLNRIKNNVSIDESLWAIWSITKLLYFNLAIEKYLNFYTKENHNRSITIHDTNMSLQNRDGIDPFLKSESKQNEITKMKGNIKRDNKSNEKMQIFMDKFKLNKEDVINIFEIYNYIYTKLCSNLKYLKEKYYVYIPFIIFESQTLMLNSGILLLNKIVHKILENNILIKLFNFDHLKNMYSQKNNTNFYNQNKDIFQVKTLSKMYKLIKCISKIFYPLKNQNIMNMNLHNNYNMLDTKILGKFITVCNDVLMKYVDYFVFTINNQNNMSINIKNDNNTNVSYTNKEQIDKIQIRDEVMMKYKNELMFVYNCLKSSLVSLIKLDLKNKYLYEWLNKNISIFQFRKFDSDKKNENMETYLGDDDPIVEISNKNDDNYEEDNNFDEKDINSEYKNELDNEQEAHTLDSIQTGKESSKSDVCLDVLALSKFTKLYNSNMKRKLIENVKDSIEKSIERFENIYGNDTNTDNTKYPSYIATNDIYIINAKGIEELYDKETRTFLKNNKNIEFHNVIMPKQLSIFINYLGRNYYLIDKNKLERIFFISLKYINITRFNYFTSNDIIHFLQGLLNYISLHNNLEFISEHVNKMLEILCYIIEGSFLKWKSSNICQLIYLLARFKYIHKNIFNKFDSFLNIVKFPSYVYEKANIEMPLDKTDGLSAIENNDGNTEGEYNSILNESEQNSNDIFVQSDEYDELLKNINISINEIKYENLGSAMWAMTALNKNVVKKKYYLKFFYLFSIYFSLHTKLYLQNRNLKGDNTTDNMKKIKNTIDDSTSEHDEHMEDLKFLQQNSSYFKTPLDTMTISIYVSTFIKKIKIGFQFLYEAIHNRVGIIDIFTLKEISYLLHSLAHVNKKSIQDTIFLYDQNEKYSEHAGDLEKNKKFNEFLNLASSLYILETDNLFEAKEKNSPELTNYEGSDMSTMEENDVNANLESSNNSSSSSLIKVEENNSDLYPKNNVEHILRKDVSLNFKNERINLSNEFLNKLMEKIIYYTSYILDKKKNYFDETNENNKIYISNANKKHKIEIIDIIKLIYSFFIFLNQKIQINETQDINFVQVENIIHQYNLIVQKILTSFNYIYLIIDTYSLISNIYVLDDFTRGIIKEFVQICIKKIEEEKMFEVEKKKILLSIQNLKETNN